MFGVDSGRGVGAIAEHVELALGSIAGQIGVGRGAIQILPRRTDAEAKTAQVEVFGIDERLEEHARGVVSAGVAFDVRRREVVAALAVGHAVEVTHLVGEGTTGEIAGELHAKIPVRNQECRQTAFHETQVGFGGQALEAHGRLELADGYDGAGIEARGGIGVDDDAPAAAEIGREPEIVDAAEGAFEGRPHTAKQEGVRRFGGGVAAVGAVVREQGAAKTYEVGTVGGADLEARGVGRDSGSRGRRGSGRFLLDLELALKDQQALLLFFDFLPQIRLGVRRRALGGLRCRLRQRRSCKWQQRRD